MTSAGLGARGACIRKTLSPNQLDRGLDAIGFGTTNDLDAATAGGVAATDDSVRVLLRSSLKAAADLGAADVRALLRGLYWSNLSTINKVLGGFGWGSIDNTDAAAAGFGLTNDFMRLLLSTFSPLTAALVPPTWWPYSCARCPTRPKRGAPLNPR